MNSLHADPLNFTRTKNILQQHCWLVLLVTNIMSVITSTIIFFTIIFFTIIFFTITISSREAIVNLKLLLPNVGKKICETGLCWYLLYTWSLYRLSFVLFL